MQPTAPTRLAVATLASALLLFSASVASAQARPPTIVQPSSSLPANQPTALPHPHRRSTAAQQAKHAQVTYSGGMLSISADNSSLNQILRQISQETGMRITGGVADERVFGQYGPSAPSQILATLLDGTGSNMLLLHRDGRDPAQLVLTPRTGGPTPPNPNAAVFNEQPEAQEPQEVPERNETREPTSPTESNQPAPAAASPSQATPSVPGEPQSPNGVKTPQQIYQQLQQLRQQPAPPQ